MDKGGVARARTERKLILLISAKSIILYIFDSTFRRNGKTPQDAPLVSYSSNMPAFAPEP